MAEERNVEAQKQLIDDDIIMHTVTPAKTLRRSPNTSATLHHREVKLTCNWRKDETETAEERNVEAQKQLIEDDNIKHTETIKDSDASKDTEEESKYER